MDEMHDPRAQIEEFHEEGTSVGVNYMPRPT